jgi:hypothetical protein
VNELPFEPSTREGGRQHKAWGEGAAATPGKRQIECASPRSGRQTLIDRPSSAARLRGLGVFSRLFPGFRATALHPGLYAVARVRGLRTQAQVSSKRLGNDEALEQTASFVAWRHGKEVAA